MCNGECKLLLLFVLVVYVVAGKNLTITRFERQSVSFDAPLSTAGSLFLRFSRRSESAINILSVYADLVRSNFSQRCKYNLSEERFTKNDLRLSDEGTFEFKRGDIKQYLGLTVNVEPKVQLLVGKKGTGMESLSNLTSFEINEGETLIYYCRVERVKPQLSYLEIFPGKTVVSINDTNDDGHTYNVSLAREKRRNISRDFDDKSIKCTAGYEGINISTLVFISVMYPGKPVPLLLPLPMIVGVACGAAALLVVVVCLVWKLRKGKTRKEEKNEMPMMPTDLYAECEDSRPRASNRRMNGGAAPTFSVGDVDYLQPNNQPAGPQVIYSAPDLLNKNKHKRKMNNAEPLYENTKNNNLTDQQKGSYTSPDGLLYTEPDFSNVPPKPPRAWPRASLQPAATCYAEIDVNKARPI